jgi:hypothetical protein
MPGPVLALAAGGGILAACFPNSICLHDMCAGGVLVDILHWPPGLRPMADDTAEGAPLCI